VIIAEDLIRVIGNSKAEKAGCFQYDTATAHLGSPQSSGWLIIAPFLGPHMSNECIYKKNSKKAVYLD